jgi:tetratricopeptide (TPR) repeat protein
MDQLAEAESFVGDIECRFEYLPAFVHLKAELHGARGNPDTAHQLIERARAVAADPERLDEDLAVAAFRAGRWEDCLSVISASQALDEQSMPDVARMRARCLANTGRAVQARDELLAFEQRTGESSVEHLDALAKICWMAGDMRRTEEAATRLVARHPQSADGYLLLGAVAQARGDLDAASRAFARAAELDPSRAVAAELARRSEAARLALSGTPSSPL